MQPRPVINVEEFIGKTVGRRVPPSGAGLQKTLNQVMAGQQRGICPRGVYRFKTHEEADEWMTKHAPHLADCWKKPAQHVE